MSRLLLLLFSTALIVSVGRAQSVAEVDSLRRVLSSGSLVDTTELKTLYRLFHLLDEANEAEAEPTLRRLISRSVEIGNPYWQGEAYRRLSFLMIQGGAYDSSLLYITQAGQLFDQSDDPRAPEKKIAAIINHGVFCQAAGELETAINKYEIARELAIELGNDLYLGKILNNLGIAFKRLDRYEAAARTYREAIVLKRKNRDSTGLAATLYNLGSISMEMDGPTASLPLFEEARQIYLLLGDTSEAATVDIGIGGAYYQSDRPERAMQVWTKALKTPGIQPSRTEAIALYMGLGDLYNKQEDFEQALGLLESARELTNEGTDAWINNEIQGALGRAHLGLGNTDTAAWFYRAYQQGIDSLTELRRLEIGQEMSEKYEAKLRNAEIERQGLLIERQRSRQLLLGLGIFVLTGLAIGIFLLYRSRLRYQRSENEAKLLVQRQRITEIEQRAELDGLRSMIEGQEAERHRVAKDLHDGLGGMLASIKTRISLGDASPDQADQLLDSACREVRRIAHNMVPQSLALSGLTGSLEDICGQLQLQGLNCELEVSGQPELRLNEREQSMLLRIVQELTHNVIKHASAERLFIQLLDQPNQLLLTVEDDGRGFKVAEKVSNSSGLGLSSVESRVNYLKGDILYDSSPGHGTTVTLTIPR